MGVLQRDRAYCRHPDVGDYRAGIDPLGRATELDILISRRRAVFQLRHRAGVKPDSPAVGVRLAPQVGAALEQERVLRMHQGALNLGLGAGPKSVKPAHQVVSGGSGESIGGDTWP